MGGAHFRLLGVGGACFRNTFQELAGSGGAQFRLLGVGGAQFRLVGLTC